MRRLWQWRWLSPTVLCRLGRLLAWTVTVVVGGAQVLGVNTAEAILVSADTPPQVAYVQGLKAYQEVHYWEAIDWLRYSAFKDPRSPNSWYYLADCYLKTQQLQPAQRIYQHILTTYPYSRAAQLSRVGLSLIALGTPSVSAQAATQLFLQPAGMAAGGADDAGGDTQLKLTYGADDYYALVRTGGRYIRWSPRDFPLKVYIQKAPKGIRFFEPGYVAAVRQAFAPWQSALGINPLFVETPTPENAQVMLKWVNGIGTQGQSVKDSQGRQGTAYTAGITYPDVGPEGLERMTVEITTANIVQQAQPPKVIASIATHEFGHVLGLMGHSDHPEDIMYAQTEHFNAALSDRDINTVRHLYAEAAQITSRGQGNSAEWQQLLADIKHQEAVVQQRPTPLEYQTLASAYMRRVQLMAKGQGRQRSAANASSGEDKTQTAVYWESKAIEAINKAVAGDPKDPAIYVTRAKFWLALNKDKEAMADLNHAQRLDPNAPGLDLQMAEAYASNQQTQQAQSALNRYIAKNPNERNSPRVKRLRQLIEQPDPPQGQPSAASAS